MAIESRAVLDASVFVRSLVDEGDDALVWTDSVIEGRVEAFAPDLIYAELANALTRYVRTGKLALDPALAILATVAALPIDSTPSRDLSMPACALAIRHGLTAYDAHYLALAEAEDAVLVTADRRLAEAASRSILLD